MVVEKKESEDDVTTIQYKLAIKPSIVASINTSSDSPDRRDMKAPPLMPETENQQNHPNNPEGELRTSYTWVDRKIENKNKNNLDKKEDNINKKTTLKKVVLKPPSKEEKPVKKPRKPKKLEVEQKTKITSLFKSVEKNDNIPSTSSADTCARISNVSEDVQSDCSPAGDQKARLISHSTDVEPSRSLLVKTHPDLEMKSENNYLVLPENNSSLIHDPND